MTEKAAQRVKEIYDELSSTRLGELSDPQTLLRKLGELRSSCDEVQAFADTTYSLISGMSGSKAAPARASTARAVVAAKPRTARRGPGRARGGVGEFNSTPFILQTVKESGASGIRAKDIVLKVQEAAPGHHVRPSALVSTILTRLKRRGEVRRRAGKWFPATA